MSEYVPDKWIVVKITGNHHPPIYKVFASWYGGWAGSDSWKLNSGIVSVIKEGYCFDFEGSSGSVYSCHSDRYGTNTYGMSVLSNMIDNAKVRGVTIEILPEETNWLGIVYE